MATKKTVRFYRIVKVKQADDPDVATALKERFVNPPDPAGVVNALDELDEPRQNLRGAYTMTSRVLPAENGLPRVVRMPHVRPDADIEIVHLETGAHRGYVTTADDEGLAEVTYIAFFPGAIVAIMRNGQASPSSGRVEEYLNRTLSLTDQHNNEQFAIALDPAVPDDRLQMIEDRNGGIRKVIGRASTPSQVSGGIREAYEVLLGRVGANIEFSFEVKLKDNADLEERERAWGEVVAAMQDDKPEKLEVTYLDEETERVAHVSLTKDVLAAKVSVDLAAGEGETGLSPTDASAARALRDGFDFLGEYLGDEHELQ